MALSPISFVAINYRDFKNDYLKAYEPGTTTPKSMALDSQGLVTVAKLQLNADGFIVTAGQALVIPFIDGAYDLWLFPTEAEADANDTSNAERVADDITGVKDFVFSDNQVIANTSRVIPFATISDAVNETDELKMFDGASLSIKERTLGNGGAANWDVVLASSVTPNTYNIVVCVGLSSLALVLRVEDGINLKAFGATGDGVADDAASVQAAVDFAVTFGGGSLVPYRRSGMEVFVPNGCYRLESQIEAKQGVVNFVGTGRFQNYPQAYEIAPTGLPVFMPVHTERNAFISDGTQENRKINFRDINIATLETGDMPTAAFGWKSGANFQRDFTFERVGIFGFESAFDVYQSGGSGVGVVKVINCAINRNANIFRCLDSQICNNLVFQDNEAGQNEGGLTLIGHALNITGNVLESNDNTIKISLSQRGCVIKGNYFEANGGDYTILLINTKGAEVGPNFYNALVVETPLLLFKSRDTIIHETDVAPAVEAAFDPKTSLGLFRINDSDYQQKGASIAKFWDNNFIKTQESQGVVEVGTTQLTNPSGYHKNIINSAGSLRSSTGSGLVTFNQAGLNIATGAFVGVSILVTYNEDIQEFPRMNVRLNNGTADGFHDAQFAEFDNTTPAGTDKLGNRTVLYTVYAKALNTITAVQTQLSPWGLNPTAGLVAVTSSPFIFTGDNNGTFESFLPQEFIGHSTTIPTSADFPQGWKVFNKDPQAGEFEGWIHVDAAGTWKGFGLVEA